MQIFDGSLSVHINRIRFILFFFNFLFFSNFTFHTLGDLSGVKMQMIFKNLLRKNRHSRSSNILWGKMLLTGSTKVMECDSTSPIEILGGWDGLIWRVSFKLNENCRNYSKFIIHTFNVKIKEDFKTRQQFFWSRCVEFFLNYEASAHQSSRGDQKNRRIHEKNQSNRWVFDVSRVISERF
jgi:hypothetical protein